MLGKLLLLCTIRCPSCILLDSCLSPPVVASTQTPKMGRRPKECQRPDIHGSGQRPIEELAKDDRKNTGMTRSGVERWQVS